MAAKKSVILVEDDPDDRELFHLFYAGRKDISILPSAGNGVELMRFLTAAADNELPDLIILDQNMPMMNGKQTLEALKSEERLAMIPTVIYSTYLNSNLLMECSRLGARMIAIKPIDDAGYQKMMDDFLKLL